MLKSKIFGCVVAIMLTLPTTGIISWADDDVSITPSKSTEESTILDENNTYTDEDLSSTQDVSENLERKYPPNPHKCKNCGHLVGKGKWHNQIGTTNKCSNCDKCKYRSTNELAFMDKESTLDSETAPSTGLTDNTLLALGLLLTSGIAILIRIKFAQNKI